MLGRAERAPLVFHAVSARLPDAFNAFAVHSWLFASQLNDQTNTVLIAESADIHRHLALANLVSL